MSINKDSLILRLGAFFVLILVLINLLLFFEHRYREAHESARMLQRYGHVAHELRRDQGEALLAAMMLERVEGMTQALREQGEELSRAPFGAMYRFEGGNYFMACSPRAPMRRPPPPSLGLQGPLPQMPFDGAIPPPSMQEGECVVLRETESRQAVPFWALILGADAILILFFIYFIRKLLPLRALEAAIETLDAREQGGVLHVSGNDEIAAIARQFNRVQARLRAVREARTLFLRNILHELKTPLMKGALLGEYITDEILRTRFARLFERMEFVLGELGRIEQLTSGEWELRKAPFRIGDLLEHAVDLLLRDAPQIVIEGDGSRIIEVDFEYFAVALKNLLDNALRYGEGKVVVALLNEAIQIRNVGQKIEISGDFSRPFNRRFEGGGLGLGLYITQTIVSKHGFALRYMYEEGVNVMQIADTPRA